MTSLALKKNIKKNVNKLKIYINYTKEIRAGALVEGYRLKSTLYLGKLKLIHAPEDIQIFDCVSNGWGRRPCDAGLWIVRQILTINKPAFAGQNRHWFAHMLPEFKTDQTDIGIHPDRLPPGTLGCNGVKIGDDEKIFQEIKTALEINKSVPVYVFHNIGV